MHDVHSCACRTEAHERMARHCPPPIDRPRLGLLLEVYARRGICNQPQLIRTCYRVSFSKHTLYRSSHSSYYVVCAVAINSMPSRAHCYSLTDSFETTAGACQTVCLELQGRSTIEASRLGNTCLSHDGVLTGRQLKDECGLRALHCWA